MRKLGRLLDADWTPTNYTTPAVRVPLAALVLISRSKVAKHVQDARCTAARSPGRHGGTRGCRYLSTTPLWREIAGTGTALLRLRTRWGQHCGNYGANRDLQERACKSGLAHL